MKTFFGSVFIEKEKLDEAGIKYPIKLEYYKQINEDEISTYQKPKYGIEIIKTGDNYQLATRKEYYEYVYKIIDKRNKPKLSNAAIETLSIIAYNPRISRAEIENIRGVNVDGTMYKLLEYGLIEEAGKLDLPGKPMSYKTTNEFLKMFGYSSLDDLPELPKYKLDSNNQIVIDELVEQNKDLTQKEPVPTQKEPVPMGQVK